MLTQNPAAYLDEFKIQRLRLAMPTKGFPYSGKVIHGRQGARVIGAQYASFDIKNAGGNRFRVAISALLFVAVRQIRHRGERVGMLDSQYPALDLEGL